MRFLIDAQLPPALARLLETKGFIAEHVLDVGLGAAEDRVIWDYAANLQATIVTKDEDFVSLITLDPNGPCIVWIRVGNTSKQSLLKWFEPLIPRLIAAIQGAEFIRPFDKGCANEFTPTGPIVGPEPCGSPITPVCAGVMGVFIFNRIHAFHAYGPAMDSVV